MVFALEALEILVKIALLQLGSSGHPPGNNGGQETFTFVRFFDDFDT